jgi:RecA/RadA recombinase
MAKKSNSEEAVKTDGQSSFIKKIMAASEKFDKDLTKFSSTLDNNTYGNIDEYIDTGSYALNRLITGSIYKGIPRGRVIGLAGTPGVGKSYLCGQVIKNAQEMGYTILFYDSENAITRDFLGRIGCDPSKIVYFPIDGIEQFKNHMIRTTKEALEASPDQKIMVVLDSYGNLSSAKEMNDIELGKENGDMGQRQKAGGAMLREATRHCGHYRIPFIFTNHVYKDVASAPNPMYAKTIMSGGQKATYMSSAVVFLTKKAEKDENTKEITGNFITCKTDKNRLAPEGKSIEMYLSFKSGPNKYYGLLETAVEAGLATEINSKTYSFPHVEEGKNIKLHEIYGKRKLEVFTKDFLDKIDEYCQKHYTYASATNGQVDFDDDIVINDDEEKD